MLSYETTQIPINSSAKNIWGCCYDYDIRKNHILWVCCIRCEEDSLLKCPNRFLFMLLSMGEKNSIYTAAGLGIDDSFDLRLFIALSEDS